MDRSSDPSPFAWILGAAVALAGIGVAVLRRPSAQRPPAAARPEGRPTDPVGSQE